MAVRLDRKREIMKRLEHHGVYSGVILAAFKARDLHLCPACGSETVVNQEGRTHDDVILRCPCGWNVNCKPGELRQAPRVGHALVDACAAVAREETHREVAVEAIREGTRRPSPRPRTEPDTGPTYPPGVAFEAAEDVQHHDAVVPAGPGRVKPLTPLERRAKEPVEEAVPVSAAAAKMAGRGKDETPDDTAGTEDAEGAAAGAGDGARRPKRRGQRRVRDSGRGGDGGVGQEQEQERDG